jgi:hypothetical protein
MSNPQEWLNPPTISNLIRQWLNNPTWNILETKGFENSTQELISFLCQCDHTKYPLAKEIINNYVMNINQVDMFRLIINMQNQIDNQQQQIEQLEYRLNNLTDNL